MNEVEKKASAKLRSEIELLTEIMNKEKESELQVLAKVIIFLIRGGLDTDDVTVILSHIYH